MDGSFNLRDYARSGRDGRRPARTGKETQTNGWPTTSDQKQSPRARVEVKKHDHSTRLLILIVGLVVFILLSKTDVLFRIQKVFGL